MENKKVLVAFFSRTGENFFPGGNRFIEKGNTHIQCLFGHYSKELISDWIKTSLYFA